MAFAIWDRAPATIIAEIIVFIAIRRVQLSERLALKFLEFSPINALVYQICAHYRISICCAGSDSNRLEVGRPKTQATARIPGLHAFRLEILRSGIKALEWERAYSFDSQ